MDRMITVKTSAELPKSFVDKVSLQVVDNKVEAVIVQIGEDSIRIVKGDSYGNTLKVLKLQPQKEVVRYKLIGKFLGMADVCEVFEDKHSADSRAYEYETKAGHQDTGLTIEEFTALVSEESI